jgi:uncharacterized membrane protein YhaH (DUF805 family)
MNLQTAVRTVLSKYAVFSGRAGRPEFWYWVLALFLVSLALAIVEGAILAPLLGFEAFSPDAGQPLSTLLSIAILLPALAVTVRRLHDTDHSGWWVLLGLIPIIGALVLLWWYIKPGTEGDNRFGPPPQSLE